MSTQPIHSRKALLKEALLFICIGGASSLMNLAFIYFFTDILHINYLLSTTIGFLGVNGAAYLANANVTFQSKKISLTSLFRYYLAISGSFAIGMLIMISLVEILSFNYLIANAIACALLAVVNFITAKFYVFRVK